jgi:predicted transposase YbfD/YdcC
VAQVKGNCPKLKQCLEEQAVGRPRDTHVEKTKGHGRHETWTVATYAIDPVKLPKGWRTVRSLAVVHKETTDTKSGEMSRSKRMYATDMTTTSAKEMHIGTRGHWGIENRLHWVKDVLHNEDNNGISKGNGPVNNSILSTMAINLQRSNGFSSTMDAQAFCMANPREAYKWIRT